MITLTMMVLLSILAVGLLSLSSVSLATSARGEDSALARANARVALAMAIGDLQKELGPDRRITAPADLAAADYGSRRRWVGVYDSWADDIDERPAPQFRRWLVSGDPESLSDEESATGTASDETRVLVGSGTLGATSDAGEHVEAGLVRSLDRHGLAWWISDEGMKATIPKAQSEPESAPEARAGLMAAAAAGIQLLPGLEQVDRDDEALDRVASVQTMDLVASPGDRSHFHALTNQSSGLATNVRAGGLQRDLSMLLERPRRELEREELYEVAEKGGINLGELADFYHLPDELEKAGRLRHPAGGSLSSDMPLLRGKKDHLSSVGDPYYAYRRLTVLRCSWVVSLSARKIGRSGENTHQLDLILDPVLTVWNPFDTAVAIQPSAFQGFKFWGIPYSLDLKLNGAATNLSFQRITGDFLMSTIYGRVEPIVIRPGEVQVISQGLKDGIKKGSSGMTTDLRLGWNFGSGFRFEVPGVKGNAATRLNYTLRPRSDGHMGVALVEFLHYQGVPRGTYEPDSVWLGGLMINRALDMGNTRLQATQAPELFPRIDMGRGRRITMSTLEGRKEPIMMFSLDMKAENDPTDRGLYQGRFSLRHNPKLPAYDLQSFDKQTLAMFPMQMSIKGLNSFKDPILDVSADGLGYAGGGYNAEYGVSSVVTHSLPREPISSIAAFQHAVANGTKYQYFSDHRSIGSYLLFPSISKAIGNSFAPPFLGPNEVEGRLNGTDAVDHSYLVNQALWDEYFFSSIAPQTSRSWRALGEARTQKVVWDEFVGDESKPLPNAGVSPWLVDAEDATAQLFSGSKPQPTADRRSAAFLMFDGRFNVNSTSRDAWKAMLASQRKAVVPVAPVDGGGVAELETAEGTAVAGLLTPVGGPIDDADLVDVKDPLQWRGFRDLSDEQIGELADAIVEQVRERGPFLSMGDFVNRRLGSDKQFALSGALQAALDDPSVSINDALNSGDRANTIDQARAMGFAFPEADVGAAAAGSPGYVKQADILTSIGPNLGVRGDTFRIRAYGEARSRDGRKVNARAWCEAVVQRVPDYVDPVDERWAQAKRLQSQANQRFGRRFVVTSFRWLSSNEI